ncbi:MAG: molybdenum cofactor guanylyltransferase [Candidatus Aminicenantales bacterium]
MTHARGDISCIILAGGRNSRMGKQKAILRLGGKTIAESQVKKLSGTFGEIIIVTNTPDAFQNVKAKIIRDILPNRGPIGGLYSGLSVSSNIHNFLVACDMPFINVKLIRYMINRIEENDIIIPLSSQGLETLYAIYSINCLESIMKQIDSGHFRLADILNFHKVRYITKKEIHEFDPQEISFFNINTPQDYEEAKNIWKARCKQNHIN